MGHARGREEAGQLGCLLGRTGRKERRQRVGRPTGLSERNGPACGIWVGFSRAVWAGPGWGFGLAGFLSFALIFLSFSFLLKQTNSNKTKLFEFKQNLNSQPYAHKQLK